VVPRITEGVEQSDITVAIDGPMGSGKSTVARNVARRLGFRYVDTGAMYRAVAVAALRRGVSPDDPEALTRLAQNIEVAFEPLPDGASRIRIDGEDVTPDLRSIDVNRTVAQVAKVPGVRAALLERQREMGRGGGVVMEGRDIGSVILPDAEVKVFLTASLDARARRRQAELAAAGEPISLEDVRRIEEEDDRLAMTRAVAPLRITSGAVTIDSSTLTVDAVVDRIVDLVRCARGL
jgi:CMP/dCMP kinase